MSGGQEVRRKELDHLATAEIEQAIASKPSPSDLKILEEILRVRQRNMREALRVQSMFEI